MAFGSSSVGLGGPSGADVVFRTNLGQFRSEIGEARQVYQRSTAQMSDAALRMSVAQEKLDRAISRYGAESRQAKQATLAYRSEMRSLEQQTERTDRELVQTSRHLDRLGRGALAGSGAFRGLGRSLAFASSSFLGGAGIVYAFRATIGAASDLHEQTTKTQAVFGAASREVLRFANTALGQAKDQALETASTIGALLRPTGLVGDQAAKVSITLTRLGTDLASFYNTNVSDALEAIRSGLVGEVEPLRRYGVQLSAARVQALALADSGKKNAKQLTDQEKLLARVKIILQDTKVAQGDYAKTIDGSANQEREWQKNLRNTEALIGQTLQPAYRNLLHSVNEYLGDAENQKRIQKQVNDAVEAGTKIVKGLASGLRLVKAAADPVVNALGGLENAAQLALIVGIVAKARRAALGFLPLQAASRATATRGVEDAALFGRAWDVATRPRNMVVTTTTTGGGNPAAGGGGGTPPIVGVPGRGGSSRGGTPRPRSVADRINQYGRNIPQGLKGLPGGFFSGIVLYGGFTAASAGATSKGTPAYNFATGQWFVVYVDPSGQAHPHETNESWIKKFFPTFWQGVQSRIARQQPAPPGPDEGTRGPSTGAGTKPGGNGPTGGARGDGLTRLQRLQLAVDKAATTGSLTDDLAAARALEAYYARIASNKKLTGDKLYQARQDLYAQQQRVQSIEDQIAADRQQAEEKAASKRAQAAERLRKAREAAQRQMDRNAKIVAGRLTQGPYATTSSGFNPVGVAPSLAKRPGEGKSAGGSDTPSREELDRFLGDFLRIFDANMQRYAPNFTGGLATHALEQLTRQQTDVLRQGIAANRFQDAPFLRRQAEAEFA